MSDARLFFFPEVSLPESLEGDQRPEALDHGDGIDLFQTAVQRSHTRPNGENQHQPLGARFSPVGKNMMLTAMTPNTVNNYCASAMK